MQKKISIPLTLIGILGVILVIVNINKVRVKAPTDSWTGFYFKDAIKPNVKKATDILSIKPTVSFEVYSLNECETRGFEIAKKYHSEGSPTSDILFCGHDCLKTSVKGGFFCNAADNVMYNINPQ